MRIKIKNLIIILLILFIFLLLIGIYYTYNLYLNKNREYEESMKGVIKGFVDYRNVTNCLKDILNSTELTNMTKPKILGEIDRCEEPFRIRTDYSPEIYYSSPIESSSPVEDNNFAGVYDGRKPPCDESFEILCDTLKFGAVCCIKFNQVCGGTFKDECEDCCKQKVCRRMTVWPYLLSCKLIESNLCQGNVKSNCEGICEWNCGDLPLPPTGPPNPLRTPTPEPTGTWTPSIT